MVLHNTQIMQVSKLITRLKCLEESSKVPSLAKSATIFCVFTGISLWMYIKGQ